MGRYLCLALALVLQLARADEEGRAKLLLHKKLTPPEGPYAIGKPINITLQDWNQDKFRTIFQGNNFTLDFLNAGEQYMHEFTVTPVKTKQGWIWAGGVIAVFALIQMYYIGSAILQK